MSQFDLSMLRGVKAGERGPRNSRFTEAQVEKIRQCWETNGGRYGLGRAIARSVGVTPGSVYWIVTGRAYK